MSYCNDGTFYMNPVHNQNKPNKQKHLVYLILLLHTDCGTDIRLDNGRANFTGRRTTFGESIPVVCDAGFRLNGNKIITCLANGTWNTLPVCEQIGKWIFRHQRQCHKCIK